MTDTIDTYAIGERNRQTILDLLHQHGPMTMTEIADLVNTSIGTVHKRISGMLDHGELARSDTPRYLYSAAVEKTTPAEVFREQRLDALERYNEARRKREFINVPQTEIRINGPRLTHICSDRNPTPAGYGGGQGKHRPARGFASTEL